MEKTIWLNFPAKDLAKTKEFYTRIGFPLNEQYTNEAMVCFEVGDHKTNVLFFPEETFRGFTGNAIADTSAGSETLVSLGAANRDEIDETARLVFEAGGTIVAPPAEVGGWSYGLVFADPDGHLWNHIYMDFDKMPKP